MKKLITLSLCLLGLTSLGAQGLLNSDYYGFELGESVYNMQHAEYFSIVADVDGGAAASGDSALMFTTDTILDGSKKIQGRTNIDEALVEFDAGSYILSLMVYKKAGSTIDAFNSNFTTTDNSEFLSIGWDLSTIEEGKWIKLTQVLALPAADSTLTKFNFQVNKGSGPGTLFVDDFTIVKDEYVMDTIPGNYLDEYYYGFEAGSSTIAGFFIPATSSAYVSFDTEKNAMQTTNKYALKFDVPSFTTLPKKANGKTNNFSIQIGSKDSLNGPSNAIVPAGVYTASINIYMEERNITGFTTPFNTNEATTQDEWFNILWTVPTDIALGEWVTLEQKLTLAMDYDTKVTFKADQKDLVDDTKNAIFYLDDYAFVNFVEDTTTTVTEGYKTGNVFNEAFFGFEKAGEATDGWFPQKNSGAGYYSFPTDVKASGTYSLLLNVPAADATVPERLKLQGIMSEGNFFTQDSGVYDMYMKVFIDENSTIKSMNTNFSSNKDADKNLIPSPFKAIVWDLTEVTKGEWVELHRVDTFPTFDRAKFTVQVTSDSLDVSQNAAILYIDDIAAVFKEVYIPMPAIKITAPKADSVFTSAEASIGFKLENFMIGVDGKVNYTLDGATAMTSTSDTAILLTELDNGAHQVIVELVDLSGASLTPIAADTIDFTVELASDIKNYNTMEMSVYPNPAQERINVSAEVGSQIQIYNLLGVQLKTAIQVSSITILDISDLKSGSYLLRTVGENEHAITKLQIR